MTVLVVLPGLDGTATLLSAFKEAVSPIFDSVQLVSYPSGQKASYAELEQIARNALPTEKPFVLLGESFSGPIAISIAANPPKNLIGLVLSATFARNPVMLLRPFSELARFAPVRMMPSVLLSWMLLGKWATPKLESLLRNALKNVSPDVLRDRAAAALMVDTSAFLGKINVPVLYLRASRDRLITRAVGNEISKGIPQAKIVEISGPHLLLQSAPNESAAVIAEFVARFR